MTRKIVDIDDQTFSALKLLAGDRMSSLQELSEEAFADLLRKHGRPTETREALKMSLAAGAKPVKRRTKASRRATRGKKPR